MSEIQPRWEWRTFGGHLGAAEQRLRALGPSWEPESDELYLVSRKGAATVKVRGGLLDVKHLQEVREDGLEQWLPVMKAAFPVSAADALEALAALGLANAALTRESYELDVLLAELAGQDIDLTAIPVRKRRARFDLDGCQAELAEVESDRGATRTIAVESEDPERVAATVRGLGMAAASNLSYPRALATVPGFGADRHAVIDVGTNSAKLYVGERGPRGAWRTVVDRAEITRLGEGLGETGRIGEVPARRTADAIAGMAEEARRLDVADVAAVGTAGLRIAANSDEFIAGVADRCGVQIEVISGDDETRLAFRAVAAAMGERRGSLVVFDTGGGSSQFTFGHGDAVDDRFSLDVGAARFTERFGLDGAVAEDVVASAFDAISAELAVLADHPVPDAVVGIGGAVTNLAAVMLGLEAYDPDAVRGCVLDLTEIDRQIELYRSRPAEARREIVGLQPGREAVILAGACIVRSIVRGLRAGSFTVSDRGLRHGVLIDRFGAAEAPR